MSFSELGPLVAFIPVAVIVIYIGIASLFGSPWWREDLRRLVGCNHEYVRSKYTGRFFCRRCAKILEAGAANE